MNDVGIEAGESSDGGNRLAPLHRSRRRVRTVVLGALGVMVLYLALTLASPSVVPRLRLLPSPNWLLGPAYVTASDDVDCYWTWEKGHLFWRQVSYCQVETSGAGNL